MNPFCTPNPTIAEIWICIAIILVMFYLGYTIGKFMEAGKK